MKSLILLLVILIFYNSPIACINGRATPVEELDTIKLDFCKEEYINETEQALHNHRQNDSIFNILYENLDRSKSTFYVTRNSDPKNRNITFLEGNGGSFQQNLDPLGNSIMNGGTINLNDLRPNTLNEEFLHGNQGEVYKFGLREYGYLIEFEAKMFRILNGLLYSPYGMGSVPCEGDLMIVLYDALENKELDWRAIEKEGKFFRECHELMDGKSMYSIEGKQDTHFQVVRALFNLKYIR